VASARQRPYEFPGNRASTLFPVMRTEDNCSTGKPPACLVYFSAAVASGEIYHSTM
jgi:hypothetical protein